MSKHTRYFNDYASAYEYYGGTEVPSNEIALIGNASYIFVSSDNSYTGGNTQYFDANMTNDAIVDTMVTTSYNSGYSYGYAEGTSYGEAIGYATGYTAGTTYGYEIGSAEGYETGYTAGTTYGYEIGSAEGYETGYTAGTTYGEAIGYTSGYNAGYSYGYDLGYIAGQASVPTTQYTLALTSSDGGTVSGGGTYNAGTIVTIEAIASTGYVFADWWDNDELELISNSSTYSFELNRNMSIGAVFNRLYTLTVSSADLSQGTVSGSGTFIAGNSVTVSAYPETGYVFDGWYENASKVSNSSTWTFSLNGDRSLVAHFRLEGLHTVNVTYDPAEGSATGGGTYSVGDTVTITASPEQGYIFSMYVVDAVDEIYDNPYSFTMPDNDVYIEVNFDVEGGGDEPDIPEGAQTCPHCNGTGEFEGDTCGICDGLGYVYECPYCGGTGEFEEESCPLCNGNGVVSEEIYNEYMSDETQTCTECGGRGVVGVYETCTTCGGLGTINDGADTCPECDGSGVFPTGETTTCPHCDGTGIEPEDSGGDE